MLYPAAQDVHDTELLFTNIKERGLTDHAHAMNDIFSLIAWSLTTTYPHLPADLLAALSDCLASIRQLDESCDHSKDVQTIQLTSAQFSWIFHGAYNLPVADLEKSLVKHPSGQCEWTPSMFCSIICALLTFNNHLHQDSWPLTCTRNF